MLTRIQKLPPHVVNQIAAGEVIERPASVVKELIENSLDAKASEITIEIEGGGSELIRVRDNGVGIHPEDLPLAITQYATSKISTAQDLSSLSTLGFRGEALASIAAISKFSLQTRSQASEHGWQIQMATMSASPAAHPMGTTVEVRDLFVSAPVRRKFLRSEKTEFLYIEKLVKRLSLCHFDVEFQLFHHGKKVWASVAANQRILDCYGRHFVENAYSVEQEAVGLALKAWIAPGLKPFDESQHQGLFVNQRWVKDKIITHALKQALLENFPYTQQFGFLLYLNLAPDTLDVNVHPMKTEVRFQEPRLIHDFVYKSVQKINLKSTTPLFVREKSADYHLTLGLPRPADRDLAMTGPLGNALALLHDHYILTEHFQGLLVVDAVKALNWLAKHTLETEWQQQIIRSAPLLIPILIESTEEGTDFLNLLGFDFSRTSPQTLAIRKIPVALKYGNIEAFFPKILQAQNFNDFIEWLNQYYSTLLQHLPKTLEDMNHLLRQLESTTSVLSEHRWWRQFTHTDLP